MTAPSQYKQEIARAVAAAATAVGDDLNIDNSNLLERPRTETHGDFACPLPLLLAKTLKRNPRDIAEQITAALKPLPFVAATNIAAPGFINFTIDGSAKTQIVKEILQTNTAYGKQAAQHNSLLLEFVSANPTGPLHVGHGRACAYGDALANILAATGVDVRREYYVNDAGRQMDILAASVWLRYWITQQGTGNMPVGSYRGDYLIAAANTLQAQLQAMQPPPSTLADSMAAADDSDAAANLLVDAARSAAAMPADYAALRQAISTLILDTVIKQDMRALNVNVEAIQFFHETTLHDNGKVAEAVATLEARKELAEKDGALWFKSSNYGDEKDRVVRRSNGDLTYFAADIAYHADKLSRPHPPENTYKIINVLGADHHGYVPRVSAAMQALGFSADSMETEIIQFVALYENGARVKMSTRAGEFITLQELIDSVGSNAARFYYLNRKNDQHLDFDITAAKAQERKNPIYYLHYANARIFSVIKRWGGDAATLQAVDSDTLTATLAGDNNAVRLCTALMQYPETLQRAANERAPHLLTAYIYNLAAQLHTFYEHTRILPPKGAPIDSSDTALLPRLALLWAVQTVFANCSALLGLNLPEKM